MTGGEHQSGSSTLLRVLSSNKTASRRAATSRHTPRTLGNLQEVLNPHGGRSGQPAHPHQHFHIPTVVNNLDIRRVDALDAHVALERPSLEAQHGGVGALEDTRRSPLGERLDDSGVASAQRAPRAAAPQQQGHALEHGPEGMDRPMGDLSVPLATECSLRTGLQFAPSRRCDS